MGVTEQGLEKQRKLGGRIDRQGTLLGVGPRVTGLFVSVIATASVLSLSPRMCQLPGGAAYLEDDFGLFGAPVVHIHPEGHRNGQAHKGNP